MKKNRQGQASTLSDSDEQKVLVALVGRHHLRDVAIFLLCLYTGMRRNECRQLLLGDVLDHEGGLRPAFALRSEITKTKEPRNVVLLQKPAQALLMYLATRPTLEPEEPLFLSQHDRMIAASTFSRVFEAAFLRAGLIGYSTHSMRRSLVTRLHAQGTPVKVISRVVGHSNISTTSAYIDVSEEQIMQALMKL